MPRSAIPRRARRRALAALLAGSLVGGCGQSGGGAGSAAQTTVPRAAPGVGQATSGAGASAPAGRPGASGADAATARAFAGSAGAQHFRVLVGDVCLAVRAGAPPALAPHPTDAALRAHAAAGADAAARTLTAFGRLKAPTATLAQLRPLSAEYQALESLYRAALAARAASPRAFVAAITRQEQRTAAQALAGGLAPCAPAGG